MVENNERIKESMIKANLVAFEQTQELSRSIVETSKTLDVLRKTLNSSMIEQISRMQGDLMRWHESIAPSLEIAQELAKQQATIIESMRPTISAIYSAQLNIIASIAKINFPTFVVSEIIVRRREFVHNSLEEELKRRNGDYYRMWDGSWKAVNSDNPDKIRQSANSMRELFRTVLHDYSDDTQIMKKHSLKRNRDITRRHRLSFILGDAKKGEIAQLDGTISLALEVDQEMQKAAHSSGEEEKFRNLLYSYEGLVWMIIGQNISMN